MSGGAVQEQLWSLISALWDRERLEQGQAGGQESSSPEGHLGKVNLRAEMEPINDCLVLKTYRFNSLNYTHPSPIQRTRPSFLLPNPAPARSPLIPPAQQKLTFTSARSLQNTFNYFPLPSPFKKINKREILTRSSTFYFRGKICIIYFYLYTCTSHLYLKCTDRPRIFSFRL